MYCNGNFIFKTITHREGGTFKNAEGAEVKYPASYILKVDEQDENGEINERKFKISEDKAILANSRKDWKTYDETILKFKITLYASRISMEVVDFDIPSYE